jgi:hypothetical protein
MSWFPRPVGPRAALSDLGAFLRQRSREQVIGGALALLVTIIIIIMFFVDSKINTAPPATVIYVEQWDANRSDAEIIADQKKDLERKRAYELEKQRQFKELENRFGM